MRKLVAGLMWVAGAYLIVRAIAEPFVIDMSDPASYANDWGGPGLIGVLAVHMLPGLLAAITMAVIVIRRRRHTH